MTTKQVKSSRLLYGLALALVITLITGAISITLLITKNQALTIEVQTVTQERDDKQKELEKLQKDHKLSMKAADGYVQAIDNAINVCSGLSIMAGIEDVCADAVIAQINQETWDAMKKVQEQVREARKQD